MFKRLLCLTLAFSLIFTIFAPTPIYAQNTPSTPDAPFLMGPVTAIKAYYQSLAEKFNAENFVSKFFDMMAQKILNLFTGDIDVQVLNDIEAGRIDQAIARAKNGQYQTQGLLGTTSQAIASLYVPPTSGIEYIANSFNTFLKPAYAQQGMGFNGLLPLLSIWRSFRNIVYVFSSLFFIIMGILIILRVKISPQAVVTIQNSIPRIFTTLILVTFSYAIAGLLIDLSSLIQNIALVTLYSSRGITNLYDSLFQHYHTNFYDITNADFFATTSLVSDSFVNSIKTTGTPGLIATLITVILTLLISAVAHILAPVAIIIVVIILATLITWLVKFFFGLFKCYVNILVRIVLAPLEIGLSAFPNSKTNFSSWIINLIANIAVFPVSLIFITIVALIIDSLSQNIGSIWIPNMINSNIAPLFIPLGIFYTSVMILSKLPDLVPQAIFQLKPSPFAQATGEGINVPFVASIKEGTQKQFSAYVGARAGQIMPRLFPKFFTEPEGDQFTARELAIMNRMRGTPPAQTADEGTDEGTKDAS